MRILVTGGTGFIGRALCKELLSRGYDVTSISRTVNPATTLNGIRYVTGDIGNASDINFHMLGKDIVVHAAAIAHVVNRNSGSAVSTSEYIRINRDATLSLAELALRNGVKRFIFISSIGVNGNESGYTPFTESGPESPQTPYAISKCEAEHKLFALAERTSLEVTVVRPPLVYWMNAPGNFGQLLKIISSRYPLPFSGIENSRSLIALPNLTDFLALVCEHPAAKNQTFLVSDQYDVSTVDIIRYISEGLEQRALLFYVPSSVVKMFFSVLGRRRTYEQAFGKLLVDSTKATVLLGWKPRLSAPDALRDVGRLVRLAKEIV